MIYIVFDFTEPEFAKLEDISSDYIERVNSVHSKGGYGSVGYDSFLHNIQF